MEKSQVESRRQARECVYALVFEYTFAKKTNERSYGAYEALISEEERPYFVNTLKGIVDHYDEMVALVMSKVKGYSSPERLNRTDLAAMVYAAYELTYRKDLPVAIVIKETVELAKKYGGEKSGSFVNGVLGAVARG